MSALQTYYGLIPETSNPPVVITTEQAGGIQGPFTAYFYVNYRNRIGYNKLSESVVAQIGVGESKRIEVIIPASVIPDPNLDVREVVLSVSFNTDNPVNSRILRKITDLNDLPFIEIFLDSSEFDTFDESAYVSAVTDSNSFLRPLSSLNGKEINVDPYAADGSPGPETKYTLQLGTNTSGGAGLLSGMFASIKVLLNQVNASNIFSNKFEYKFYGIYDYATGQLNSDDFANTNIWYFWDASNPVLQITSSLQPGTGVYLGIRPRFDIAELPEVGKNSFLQFYPFLITPRGKFNDLSKAFGNTIFPVDGRLRILPQKNLRIKKTSGYGIIFDRITPFSEQRIIDVSGTPSEQWVWLDSDGVVGLSNDAFNKPLDAANRAVIKFDAGIGGFSGWSTPIDLENQGVSINLTLREFIKNSYADKTLAGLNLSGEGIFNPSNLIIFIQNNPPNGPIGIRRINISSLTVDGELGFSVLVTRQSEFQTFDFSEFEDSVGMLSPIVDSATQNNSITSDLDGRFRFAAAYEWDGLTVSSVLQDESFGLIPELPYTVTRHGQDSAYWLQYTESLLDDPDASEIRFYDGAVKYQRLDGGLWTWVANPIPPALVSPLDSVIQPTASANIGYWSRMFLYSEEAKIKTNGRIKVPGGTLTNTLDYIDQRFQVIGEVLSVDTIVDLRAINSSSLVPYQQAHILRYNSLAVWYPELLFRDNLWDVIQPNDRSPFSRGRWLVQKWATRTWVALGV